MNERDKRRKEKEDVEARARRRKLLKDSGVADVTDEDLQAIISLGGIRTMIVALKTYLGGTSSQGEGV